MAEVRVGTDESVDSLLRRFNKKVHQDGILAELRRQEFYEKPSVKRKHKQAEKRRAVAKAARIVKK